MTIEQVIDDESIVQVRFKDEREVLFSLDPADEQKHACDWKNDGQSFAPAVNAYRLL